ncbi:MAG TPA: hypothetical protein VMT19_11990 [Thermoanaerobaculaceae bacterium]|nr:hypothetical protein [Thermoanaerobaculaceae bacterium]
MTAGVETRDTVVLDVQAAAEDHVIGALRRLRCSIVRRTSEPGEVSPIEAWKVTEHILMHVRGAVTPDEPPPLTPRERDEFRRLAARANAEPWIAEVALGNNLELVRLDWWPMESREPRE